MTEPIAKTVHREDLMVYERIGWLKIPIVLLMTHCSWSSAGMPGCLETYQGRNAMISSVRGYAINYIH